MKDLLTTAVESVLGCVQVESDEDIARELLDDIAAGRAFTAPLLAGNGDVAGTIVYEARGRDLIIHAVFSRHHGDDMTEAAAIVGEQLRLANACNSIRCDTRRPGLIRKLIARGWGVESVALAKHF